MYISDVSGHRSATQAIEKALKYLEPDTEILNINAFNYTNPISEKVISRLYMGVIKMTPHIWDYLYDNPSVVKKLEKIKKRIHKFNSPKLKVLFDRFRPDAVLCSQAFPCGMVADYKYTYNSGLPLVAVLTDYVPHSYWLYDAVDYYVTPSLDVSHRLIKKGIPPEKIKALGIPFDQKFNDHLDQERIRHKLRLDPHSATVLIMGGGQGLGPIKTIVKSLEKVRQGIQEIVVCGTNKKLYKGLKRKIKKYKKKIVLLGFISNVHELMSASDIIITKPGGVTTAEVLTKKIPMVIVKPIPGQEANNAVYLTKKGAAIKLDNPQETSSLIEELLINPQRLEEMANRSSEISKPQASLDIAKLLLELPHG
jgi:processive 1,2-diacylglycerol beta-glucosyltransferase